GNLAAMPSERLPDSETGLAYHALLAEVRSIGGLSGSPVFAFLGPSRVGPDGTLNIVQAFFVLIGVVRSHWEHKEAGPITSAFADELSKVNWGDSCHHPINRVGRHSIQGRAHGTT